MDENTIPIGIPCMTEAQVGSRNFFFVHVHVQIEAVPEQRTLQQVSGAKCVQNTALNILRDSAGFSLRHGIWF